MSGTIGIAVVTWEVTPADSNTFVVNSGQAVFENGQETADIEIEVSSKCLHTCVHTVHAYVCAYSACMRVCVCQITREYGVERERERERVTVCYLCLPGKEIGYSGTSL